MKMRRRSQNFLRRLTYETDRKITMPFYPADFTRGLLNKRFLLRIAKEQIQWETSQQQKKGGGGKRLKKRKTKNEISLTNLTWRLDPSKKIFCFLVSLSLFYCQANSTTTWLLLTIIHCDFRSDSHNEVFGYCVFTIDNPPLNVLVLFRPIRLFKSTAKH